MATPGAGSDRNYSTFAYDLVMRSVLGDEHIGVNTHNHVTFQITNFPGGCSMKFNKVES